MFKDGPVDARFIEIIEQADALGSAEAIPSMVDKITGAYGLKHVSYISLNLPSRDQHDPYIFATYSPEWIAHYREYRYYKHDPVITRGFASILPVNWAEFDLSPRRIRSFFGEAREFGVGRSGMTFPIRGRHGEQALFSITSDQSEQEWNKQKTAYMRDFQLIAYHVHRAVLMSEGLSTRDAKLAPREVECLRLIARGKSRVEAAELLGLMPNTIRYYLETARSKLGAVNATHAVAKAISSNLISIGP